MSLTLDVFVSSPGDMQAERTSVGKIVAELALQSHVRWFCSLRALFYERMVPPMMGVVPQKSVNTFMMDPARCDVLVCLLGDRLGTEFIDPRTKEKFDSGTEYELVTACESTKRPRPEVMGYFRAVPGEGADPVERARVVAFKEKIGKPGARLAGFRPEEFADLKKLEERLPGALNAVVWRLIVRHLVWQGLAWASAAVLVVAALVAAHLLTRRSDEERAAAAVSEARAATVASVSRERARVADMVLASDSLEDAVTKLGDLGSAAADSLMKALRAQQKGGSFALLTGIVNALKGLAGSSSRESCGCPQLLSVLKVDNLETKYCATTHKLVLEALKDVSCRETAQMLDPYQRKIDQDGSLMDIICSDDDPSSLAGLRQAAADLKRAVARAP